MSTEENKIRVQRLIDAVNKRDFATIDEVMSPELARYFRERAIPWIYATFGDEHRTEITDVIAEGDKVWARLATSGGHTGEWMGVPPTGKRWTNTGVYYVRIARGKIVEVSSLFDNLNLLQQLGATIAPPKS